MNSNILNRYFNLLARHGRKLVSIFILVELFACRGKNLDHKIYDKENSSVLTHHQLRTTCIKQKLKNNQLIHLHQNSVMTVLWGCQACGLSVCAGTQTVAASLVLFGALVKLFCSRRKRDGRQRSLKHLLKFSSRKA